MILNLPDLIPLAVAVPPIPGGVPGTLKGAPVAFDVMHPELPLAIGMAHRRGETALDYPKHPVYVIEPSPETGYGDRFVPGALYVWDGEHFYETYAWHGAYRLAALLTRWKIRAHDVRARPTNPGVSFRERKAQGDALDLVVMEMEATLNWVMPATEKVAGAAGASLASILGVKDGNAQAGSGKEGGK